MHSTTAQKIRRYATATLLVVGVSALSSADAAEAQTRTRRSTSSHRRVPVTPALAQETVTIALW